MAILLSISFLPLIHATASIYVADTTTIDHEISGPGGFKKTGPGTLVLSVLNSYTGPTEVETGALSITHLSALANTSAVTVDSGATFSCDAASPTTYSIGGPYIQKGQLTLNISPDACDCLNVTGLATLGGNLVLNGLTGVYPPGISHPILTATGGFGGTTFSSVSISGSPGFIFHTNNLKYGSNTISLVVTSKVTPMTINIGSGGMALGPATLSYMASSAADQLVISGTSALPTVLNNPLIIKARITAPLGILSTQLNSGGVIRINSIPALTTAQYATAHGNIMSGFTAAFGMPAPIWGDGSESAHPWIIIAPTNAPTYAFRPAGSAGALGWADGIVAHADISNAIVIDPMSLAALVAATKAATGLTPAGVVSHLGGPTPSASGIVSYVSPASTSARWNIGVTSCGLGAFVVQGSSLQALLAATNGGQLVVANGATIG